MNNNKGTEVEAKRKGQQGSWRYRKSDSERGKEVQSRMAIKRQ